MADRRGSRESRTELRPDDLAGLLVQSLLLAASLGFTAAIVLTQFTPLPRAIAFAGGLELGLLASYPTMRLIARANGSILGFWKWAAITVLPAGLGLAILLIV
jgi:hypothetical protein